MKRRLLTALLLSSLATLAIPVFVLPNTVTTPIDRLLTNAKEIVRNRPDDAAAHYALGRLYALSVVTEKKPARVLSGSEQSGQIPVFSYMDGLYQPVSLGERLGTEQVSDLRSAIFEYQAAVRLDPQNARYRLGLGWTQQIAIPHAQEFGESRTSLARQAMLTYKTAVRLDLKKDMAETMVGPDRFFSWEAASRLVELLGAFPQLGGSNEKAFYEKLEKQIREVPRSQTPILIPLNGETQLGELVSNHTTSFDIAGDSIKRQWPWVRYKTGILVWDPLRRGEITSGRDLFGSATWWMFYQDGYQALAALDNDHDGWLVGGELRGIRMWIDRDGDGKSQAAEVRDLAEFDVEALCTSGQPSVGGPFAPKGVRWTNGTTSPTFDWTPTSVPKEQTKGYRL